MREIADKWNRKLKYAFCGLALLMRVTHFSRRGIQKALKSLERKGFLVIDRSQTKYRTSMYYLMFDAMEKVLSGAPLPPSEMPKKCLDFVAKIQKVHPNIGNNINTLSTLRSKQNAFEKSQAEDITPKELRLKVLSYDVDERYKEVVTLIQLAALRHGGSQKDLLSRYFEIAGNSSLNDELKENLHHNEQLIVKAVIFLLLQLRSANSYISGTLKEMIKILDGSNVSSA